MASALARLPSRMTARTSPSRATTRYCLSLDPQKSPDDERLTGTRAVGMLGPTVPSQGTKMVTVPATTVLGDVLPAGVRGLHAAGHGEQRDQQLPRLGHDGGGAVTPRVV